MTESDQPPQLNGAKKLLPEATFRQLLEEKQTVANIANEKYGQVMTHKEGKSVHFLGTNEGATAITDQENLLKLAKDPLTGLDNRETWTRKAINLVKLFLRSNDPNQFLTLTLTDIDDFKKINDQYGHATGDNVLTEIGKRMEQEFRDTDLLGKYGGDELLQMGIGSGDDSSKIVAEFKEKHHAISEQPLKIAKKKQILATQSWGLAIFSHDYLESLLKATPAAERHDDDYQKLLTNMLCRSDRALYQSKKSGKNQLTFHAYSYDWVI